MKLTKKEGTKYAKLVASGESYKDAQKAILAERRAVKTKTVEPKEEETGEEQPPSEEEK